MLCPDLWNLTKNTAEFYHKPEIKSLKELKKDKYEVVDGIQPLILYYYYRLNEIANVRTIMVGLNNGIDREQIKQRVRENYAG